MKKAFCIIAIAACLLTTACTPETSASQTIESNEIVETAESNTPATDESFSAKPVSPCYDDVFVEFNWNTELIGPMSYDELMNMITDPKYNSLDSFYLFETVRVLTTEESSALKGWDKGWDSSAYYDESSEALPLYPYDKTIYEVKVIKDLISGEAVEDTIYISIGMSGPDYQDEGDPVYAPNELFTAVLSKPEEGCDVRRATGGDVLRLSVEQNDNGLTAFSRSRITTLPDVLSGFEKIRVEKVTSTTANPARYYYSIPLDDLVHFLKEDWQSRGVCTHFEISD